MKYLVVSIISLVLIVLILLAIFLPADKLFIPGRPDVEIVEVLKVVKVEIEVPGETVVIEKITEVEKPVYVEVEKYLPRGDPRFFSSQDEAQQWFDGVTIFPLRPDICQLIAEEVFRLALKDGFIVYPVPVYQGRIWGVKVTGVLDYHMGLLVPAGEYWYYVETNTEDSNYWKVVPIQDSKVILARSDN